MSWNLVKRLACCAALLVATAASAQDRRNTRYDDRGTFSVIVENDVFAGGTDRNYTNGIKVSYLSGIDRVPRFADWLGRNLLRAGDGSHIHAGLALGQSLFTPQDIRVAAPLPDQHPYAGWLYTSFSLLVDHGNVLDTLALDLGLVGPDAGGEWTQSTVHDLIETTEPRGWDNQLENEPGLVLTYERKWRALAEWDLIGLGVDLTPTAGFSLGNVLTQGAGGLTLRIGNDLANDYGPPRIRPSLAGGGFFTPRDSFGWYLFAGASGRAVAYNIFLDGNTLRDSPEVDRRPFVADFQAGVVLQVKRVQVGLTLVTRTEEFETQDEDQIFGAITIGYKL